MRRQRIERGIRTGRLRDPYKVLSPLDLNELQRILHNTYTLLRNFQSELFPYRGYYPDVEPIIDGIADLREQVVSLESDVGYRKLEEMR